MRCYSISEQKQSEGTDRDDTCDSGAGAPGEELYNFSFIIFNVRSTGGKKSNSFSTMSWVFTAGGKCATKHRRYPDIDIYMLGQWRDRLLRATTKCGYFTFYNT